MENEIMNYEEEVMDSEVEVVETEGSGISTGAAVLIGAGLAGAAYAVVKLVQNLVAKHKAKKEVRRPDEDELIEPTDAQIMEVTK